MGTHPIFESDFDCLTDFEFGNKLRKNGPIDEYFGIRPELIESKRNRIVMQDSGQANQNQPEQAKPRTTNQLDYIKKVVFKSVAKHKHAWPFQKPVDPKELGLPDYFDVVKKPMDLSTIKKKIDRNEYLTGSEALADFRLMFSNCYLYNKPTDDVTLMCQEVESFFKQLVKKVPEPEVDIVPPEPPVKAAGVKPVGAKATPKNAKKQRPPPVAKTAAETTSDQKSEMEEQ